MMRRVFVSLIAAIPLAAGGAVAQELPPDPHAIWTLQDENASISSARLSDRYYVNGLHLGYVSGTDDVPDFLQRVGRAVWTGGGQLRFGFSLTQQIYTPAETGLVVPPPGDQPYAATLLGNFQLYRDVPDSRSILGLSVGVVGPWAFGEQIQNGFHDLIGQNSVKGWGTQLRNEPAFELTSARTWRLSMGSVGGLETDALPDLAVGLGNLRVYAQTGVIFRIGQGLDSDYGVPRLFPGPTGGDAFRPTRPFAWYVFLGADGQGVAHDMVLNGNMYHTSASVAPIPYFGEVEAGIAFIVFGTRLSYTQVVQSQQFEHQKGGPHQLGSLALSVRF
jgi:lipid A 3-O-deacylase